MKKRTISVAVAALVAGATLGGVAHAQITTEDLATFEAMVQAGQVEQLKTFLDVHPELLALKGALGKSLRDFYEAPSANTLAAVENTSTGQLNAALAPKANVVRQNEPHHTSDHPRPDVPRVVAPNPPEPPEPPVIY